MSPIITDITQVVPDWLTHLLREKGYLSKGAVSDISVLESSQTNVSKVYHLVVSYSGVAEPLSAPARLFLKIPTSDFARDDKEIAFYTSIAPFMRASSAATDWPFLHCYEAAYSAATGRAYFLFEDLSQTHFTLEEMMPPQPHHREQVIDAYALFHAFWWEHPRLGQEIGELLTSETIENFLGTAQKRLRHLIDDLGTELPKSERHILENVASTWPARRRERVIQGKGVTLVHRDPHPRNFLYPKNENYGTVKLIDWQSWRVDTGTDDLAYLMACHWPPKRRIELEADLVKHYYEQLLKFGVKNYTWDDCRYDYQASIIRCLFFLMIAWSPKQWERIRKGLQSFNNWNCIELL